MDNLYKNKLKFFKEGNTLSYKFRLGQLKNLKRVLKSREDEIISALAKDLAKPEYEAFSSELGLIYIEINHAIKNLSTWMKDNKYKTPIFLQPALSYTKANPKGVVLILSPWNYPFLLSLTPLIGAIASGNCAVLKPSSKARESSRVLKNIIDDAFEDNYISLVEGPGSLVVEPMIKENNFNHIFFTGSKKVGLRIGSLASKNLTPITLELGGKSPAIVHGSTNIDLAAKKITWAKFFNCGQTCIAPDYVLIDPRIKDEFIKSMVKYIKIFYGDNIKNNKDYGRIINKESFLRLKSLINPSNIIYGGSLDQDDLFIEPCLLTTSLDEPIMSEEIFGPLLPIITFKDGYDIARIIEKNPNPLALYLFSKDKEFNKYIINRISFGGGCINDTMSHMINTNLPFGGIGDSGLGKYHSYSSFKEFSHFKSIVKGSSYLHLGLKFPPYSRIKTAITKFFLK